MLTAAPAAAQDNIVELPPIEVEALRSGIVEGAVPGSIEIIDGSEIVKEGHGDLPKFLSERVSGLTPENGTISGASLNLRGRNVQVLVNGVPRISELRGFSRELALIDPQSVERVEIIKGATALYGNGATGGLINIVTRAADEPGFHADARGQLSFQTEEPDESLSKEFMGGIGYRSENFGVRLDLGASLTGSSFAGDGEQRPSDPLIGQGGGNNLDRYNISATADYTVGSHEFELSGTVVHLDQDIDYNTDFSTDPVSVDFSSPYQGEPVKDDTRTFIANYRNRDFAVGDLKLTAFYSSSDRRAVFVPYDPVANPLVPAVGPATNVPSPGAQTELSTEQFGARAQLTTSFSFADFTYGLDYQHDNVSQMQVDGREAIAPMSQDSIAAFAEANVPVTKYFDLRAGVRFEKFFLEVEDFTRPAIFNPFAGRPGFPTGPAPARDVEGGSFDYGATVFNIGGVFHATRQLDLFAGFSQGFSIPDVGAFTRRAGIPADLSSPAGLMELFNPAPISFADIQPEAAIVNNYEVGARFDHYLVSVDTSLFLSTSDEGTTFDPATNQVSQQEEIIYGGELNIHGNPTEITVLGAVLAYTEGRYDSDGDGDIDSFLPNNRIVAPVTATLYGGYDASEWVDGLNVGGTLRYTSSRDRDPAGDIDSTFTIDLRASYDTGYGTVYAHVDNLMDSDQQNPSATSVRNLPVAAEGRRFFVGYGVKF